ncbi:25712_t:CDS:2 [Gigaspora margarita]|uniref:25712_t:CDS:1 n=1 Tax=Gigaspora margarita TaxID=4874 RepID=A0ABN7W733_GIGMA|nr:25712_t:CDS:2 [Gigaspora margarita]
MRETNEECEMRLAHDYERKYKKKEIETNEQYKEHLNYYCCLWNNQQSSSKVIETQLDSNTQEAIELQLDSSIDTQEAVEAQLYSSIDIQEGCSQHQIDVNHIAIKVELASIVLTELDPENNMDLGEVPEELQELTEIEKMLIALVFLVISVYRLQEGQLVYHDNVINFPQDVQEFTTRLP